MKFTNYLAFLLLSASPPALTLALSPPSATEACNAAGGSLVATASTTGGDGNPVTFSMTGNTTDFAIDSSTGAITVAPGGIASADCGQTYTNVVTAMQP